MKVIPIPATGYSEAFFVTKGGTLLVQNITGAGRSATYYGSRDGGLTFPVTIGTVTLGDKEIAFIDPEGMGVVRFSSPVAGSFSVQEVGGASAGPLVLVSDNNQLLLNTATGKTGGTYETHRCYHRNISGKAIKGIRLVYGNFTSSGGTEAAGPNSIVVAASFQRFGTSVSDQTGERMVATFNGAKTVTIEPGATVISDFIAVDIGVGEAFYTLNAVTPSGSNTIRPCGNIERGGGTAQGGRNNGEGANTTTDVTVTGTVTVGIGNQSWRPIAVVGLTSDGSRTAAVACIGDSFPAGNTDNAFSRDSGGFVPRGFGGWSGYDGLTPTGSGVPFSALGIGGETVAQAVILDNLRQRFLTSGYCTHVMLEHGTNDLGGVTATIQANMLTMAVRHMVAGRRVIRTTILPRATSTDGYKTGTNQTVGANETQRTTLNSWIRDTGPTGFVAQATEAARVRNPVAAGCMVLDICVPVEVNASGVATLNGGLWTPWTGAIAVTDVAAAGSTTSAVKIAASVAIDTYRGYTLRRVANSELRTIWYHAAHSGGVITMQIRDAFSTMTAGDDLEIYPTPVADGTQGVHPGSWGHKLMGDYVQANLAALTAFF